MGCFPRDGFSPEEKTAPHVFRHVFSRWSHPSFAHPNPFENLISGSSYSLARSSPNTSKTPTGGKASVRLRSALAQGGSPAARGKRRCIWTADLQEDSLNSDDQQFTANVMIRYKSSPLILNRGGWFYSG